MRLEALQQMMEAAIDGGPDHVAAEAFAGGAAAAMRGLRIHANTISHARLIALEETFPRSRATLGEARFNQLSREFCESAAARAEPLAAIGRGFPAFLALAQDEDAERLATFEWAWLDAFHAAEAQPLALAELAGLDEQAMLDLPVALHPAVRCVSTPADPALLAEIPAIAETDAIFLTRPQETVLVSPASPAMARLFAQLSDGPAPICNLLATIAEQESEDMLGPLIAMLEIGSLVLTE